MKRFVKFLNFWRKKWIHFPNLPPHDSLALVCLRYVAEIYVQSVNKSLSNTKAGTVNLEKYTILFEKCVSLLFHASFFVFHRSKYISHFFAISPLRNTDRMYFIIIMWNRFSLFILNHFYVCDLCWRMEISLDICSLFMSQTFLHFLHPACDSDWKVDRWCENTFEINSPPHR